MSGRNRLSADQALLRDVQNYSQIARGAPAGSAKAVEYSQRAVAALLGHLWHARPYESAQGRDGWIAALEFLCGTHSLPELDSLLYALRDLNRDVIDERLSTQGKGGPKRTADDFYAMRAMVEAANEIKAHYPKDIAWRAQLQALGTSYSTIKKYEKQLVEEAPQYTPRLKYFLAWGTADPAELIKLGLKALEKDS